MIDIFLSILVSFWETFAEMSPYLLFGFFVAGTLSILINQQFVERHLGGKGIWPLVKASIFGVPLPLCSCGVIPVAMSLHKHGASKGSTVSFLLSTPQTGMDSIFVTLSLLGPIFAVFRPLAAFITGVVGGSLVNIVTHSKEHLPQEKCEDECCSTEEKKNKIMVGLKYGFVTLPRDIGKAMFIGIAVAAVIAALVPDDFLVEKLGKGILPMLIMMVLGIPVYVCATASVPLAAVLIMKGLSPGAALVFLMTGPATNAASFVVILKSLGAKTAITYILAVAGCALAAGITLDFVAVSLDFSVVPESHWMLPPIVKYISAIVLLAVLGFAIFGKKKKAD